MLFEGEADSTASLAECLRLGLAQRGLDVNGTIPGDPEIPIALDVRHGLGPILFQVRLSQGGSMISAGIVRPGERIEGSWPHLAPGVHADGRCFRFFPRDRQRGSSLFQAVMSEADLHRPPSRKETESLSARLAELLPGVDTAALSVVAAALATGLSDGHRSALDRRLAAIEPPAGVPVP